MLKVKDNIDLTENRIFSRRQSDFAFMSLDGWLFKKLTKKNHPWELDYSILDRPDYDQLVITGDKKQRAYVKEGNLYNAGKFCERCGKRLDLKPWNILRGLCESCEIDMKRDCEDKCKWRMKDVIVNIRI